jgi:hypothetical protein
LYPIKISRETMIHIIIHQRDGDDSKWESTFDLFSI